jgi:hypothetical protein
MRITTHLKRFGEEVNGKWNSANPQFNQTKAAQHNGRRDDGYGYLLIFSSLIN